MDKQYTTRNLTVQESAELMRKLHLKLGKFDLATSALSVIAEMGAGIFMAEEKKAGV